jgi:hypothetical protein
MTWDTVAVTLIVGTVLALAFRSLRRTVKSGESACGCSGGGCHEGLGSCGREPLTRIGNHGQR